MNEIHLLSAMSGLDDELLCRSEIKMKSGVWKKVLPLAACCCLILVAAWFGLKPEPQENAPTVPQPTVLTHSWEVTYNESKSVHSADRAFPLGYFTEELSSQELEAVLPEKSYGWMNATGVAGFTGEGKLVNVRLTVTTNLPDSPVYVILGDEMDCCVVITDMVLSKCGDLEYSVYQYTSENQDYKLDAYVNIADVPARFSMTVPYEQLELAKADFEAVMECFAWYENGRPDLSAVTPEHIPEWYDKAITWEEAAADEQFGKLWLTQVPEGFTQESVRRHKDMWNDYLSGLWTCGLNELSWRIRYFNQEDADRVTSVADKENYDLSLYPIPRADSVPDELFQIVNDPIFQIEELTLEAIRARAYTVDDAGDTSGPRMQFSVQYADRIISVNAKGVDPQWLYEQLKALQ